MENFLIQISLKLLFYLLKIIKFIGLEDIADTCRKTCGICCEDINYACEDDTSII